IWPSPRLPASGGRSTRCEPTVTLGTRALPARRRRWSHPRMARLATASGRTVQWRQTRGERAMNERAAGGGGERVRARTAAASPEALRTDHLWAYNLQAPLRVATRGEGCYLYDAEGRRYLDGAAGFVVA